MLEGVGEGIKTLKSLIKGSFIVADIITLSLAWSGELNRYFIEGTIKTVSSVKEASKSLDYALSNGGLANPASYNTLYGAIIKSALDIGTIAWLGVAAMYSAHWLICGVKGKKP